MSIHNSLHIFLSQHFHREGKISQVLILMFRFKHKCYIVFVNIILSESMLYNKSIVHTRKDHTIWDLTPTMETKGHTSEGI